MISVTGLKLGGRHLLRQFEEIAPDCWLFPDFENEVGHCECDGDECEFVQDVDSDGNSLDGVSENKLRWFVEPGFTRDQLTKSKADFCFNEKTFEDQNGRCECITGDDGLEDCSFYAYCYDLDNQKVPCNEEQE